MDIRAAICDDEREFALLIKKYITEYFRSSGFCFTAEIFTDSGKFLDTVLSRETDYQVLFLDIDMPQMSGLDLASRLRGMEEQPYFIFVSGMESLVFQTFTVNPFWFVRKRLWKEELPTALSALKKEFLSLEMRMVPIQAGQSVYKIDVRTLLYVECTNKTLHFHYRTPQKNKDLVYKLSDLEELLAPYGFIRVHKGFLVNYRCIYHIGRSGISLDNNETIPVSKYRIQEIKELYGSLI